jgi:hypothetical protein
MGMHKIEITMTGGHGCDRGAKEGEPLAARCGQVEYCPDCAAAAFVDKFKAKGAFNFPGHGATFTHWPGEAMEVVDDLVTGVRVKGHF